MAQYSFVTTWRIPASMDAVWEVLTDDAGYSEWWPCFVSFRKIEGGDEIGVGSRVEREVKGLLPYRLKYQTLIVALDPPREAQYVAEGDLHGEGRNTLAPDPDGSGTIVTFYWDVWTTGLALNLLAPMLKPLFAWNHNWVMAQGERGLIEKLAPSRVS